MSVVLSGKQFLKVNLLPPDRGTAPRKPCAYVLLRTGATTHMGYLQKVEVFAHGPAITAASMTTCRIRKADHVLSGQLA